MPQKLKQLQQEEHDFVISKNILKSSWDQVYAHDNNIYVLALNDSGDLASGFTLYKHNELQWSIGMHVGAELQVTAYDLDGEFALQFQQDDAKRLHPFDVYYRGEFLSKKFGVDGVGRPFIVDGKIGYFAQKNSKWFLVFNGRRASENFDFIRIHACCMGMEYPFEVYADGIIQFVGRRDNELYWTRVDTTRYTN